MRRGFSLVELLVALVVMGIVLALLTPLVFGARNMVQSDQLRTSALQSVRGGSDLIGSDIRMAGERFPRTAALQLSPIVIVPGEDGESDEIILRRNLWDSTLPSCENTVQGTQQNIRVVRDTGWLNSPQGQNHPECGQPVGSDGWPVNLSQVRALADTIGTDGHLRGYLFDPANQRGEFITFFVPANADNTGQIRRNPAPGLQFSYPLGNRPRIYILSERHYRVRDDVLELLVEGDVDNPLRVSADITRLEARFELEDGSLVAELPAGTTWRDIRSVQLTLVARSAYGPDAVERELTSRFFPRNILSR